MATNKQAIIRYRVIDKCLRKVDKPWSWQALAEACTTEIEALLKRPINGISERTIKGDIMSMRSDERLAYFAPIAYDYKEKSYYYTDRTYSITEAPISKPEAEELGQLIALMRQFVGFKHLHGIENILHKLELLVFESTKPSTPIVQLEQPFVLVGLEWLDNLYQSAKEKKAITIRYQPFEGEVSNVLISPYLLKEYKNRWFLFALKHDNQELRTYGLERIKNITPSIAPYIQSDFNPEEYFEDIIGVSLDKSVPRQLLKFSVTGPDRHYILTNPIHHSQKVIAEAKGSITFSIEVRPNHELQKIFRSYGDALSVLNA
jgi:predicted DNA-binding transcriptional regulator YafY